MVLHCLQGGPLSITDSGASKFLSYDVRVTARREVVVLVKVNPTGQFWH